MQKPSIPLNTARLMDVLRRFSGEINAVTTSAAMNIKLEFLIATGHLLVSVITAIDRLPLRKPHN